MIVFEEPINGDLTSRRTSSNATNVTSSVTYQRNLPEEPTVLEELHGDLVNEGVLSQSNRSFLINLPMVMIVFEEPTNGDLASRRTLSNATNVTSFVTYQRNQPCLKNVPIL